MIDEKINKFREELRKIINQLSMENRSDTPDFILADYLTNCLLNYEAAIRDIKKWYTK